jgi:peptide deformylase
MREDFPKQELLDSMFETMREAGGIGLAANQVGILKRFFVMDTSKRGYKRYKKVIINPKIVAIHGDLMDFNEGCLSYPDQYVQKKRYKEIVVTYLDKNGDEILTMFKDLEAIVFQHELDHLNGVPFLESK